MSVNDLTKDAPSQDIDLSDLKITTLGDVEAEQVKWLWKGRLPRGKLIVFDGDPELGKSTLGLTFAAVITTEYETEDGVMGGPGPTVAAANTRVTSSSCPPKTD